ATSRIAACQPTTLRPTIPRGFRTPAVIARRVLAERPERFAGAARGKHPVVPLPTLSGAQALESAACSPWARDLGRGHRAALRRIAGRPPVDPANRERRSISDRAPGSPGFPSPPRGRASG